MSDGTVMRSPARRAKSALASESLEDAFIAIAIPDPLAPPAPTPDALVVSAVPRAALNEADSAAAAAVATAAAAEPRLDDDP